MTEVVAGITTTLVPPQRVDCNRDRGPLDADGGRRLAAMERLVAAALELSSARDLDSIMAAVGRAARELVSADGATFVLRDGDCCLYAEEDAISPLWKGARFPLSACIGGWVIRHGEPVVVDDVYADDRMAAGAFRSTFVKSLAMVPIDTASPRGAIGSYWALRRRATADELHLLEALAEITARAMESCRLFGALRDELRSRDAFLSLAAHELRTPLTALSLQLETLTRVAQSVADDPLQLRSRLQRAMRGTQRLGELIERLLELSHISLGQLSLSLEPFDLAEAARAAIDRVRQQAERAGCDLRVDAPRPVVGRWDRERLVVAIESLVANAVKFGAAKPVEVLVRSDGVAACLKVRDHGVGIAAADQATLFAGFGRSAPASGSGSLGMGLYITRRIVEAHRGKISVASAPNAGACFTLELPLHDR